MLKKARMPTIKLAQLGLLEVAYTFNIYSVHIYYINSVCLLYHYVYTPVHTDKHGWIDMHVIHIIILFQEINEIHLLPFSLWQ